MSLFWPYALIVVLVAVEGEATILLAAGVAATGYLNPFSVMVAATLGNLIADVLWFALGYYGKIDWLIQRVKWLGITAQKMEALKRLIHRDVIKLLIIAKLTNWMMIPALVATGVARVPWKRWFPLIFVSDLIIGTVMVSLGYFMTASLLQIQKGVQFVAVAFTLLFVLFAAIYIRRIMRSKDWMSEMEDPSRD